MGIFDVFKSKKIKSSSNDTVLKSLANDIHKKFHATCDVLEKIKTKVSCVDLIKQLNLAGVSENKYATNTFEIDLDTGNGNLFAKIENADHSLSNFQRYSFSITGIQDYQGLYMSFSYEDKKRTIDMIDNKMWGKMSNPDNQALLDQMEPTSVSAELYELILAKGGFKKNKN